MDEVNFAKLTITDKYCNGLQIDRYPIHFLKYGVLASNQANRLILQSRFRHFFYTPLLEEWGWGEVATIIGIHFTYRKFTIIIILLYEFEEKYN